MSRRFVMGVWLTILMVGATTARGQDDPSKAAERTREAKVRQLAVIEAELAFAVAQDLRLARAAIQRPEPITFPINVVSEGERITSTREIFLFPKEEPPPESPDPEIEDDVDRPPTHRKPTGTSYTLADTSFDHWGFGENVLPDDRRSRLNAVLITDADAAKLNLAGSGDIKRFLDEVDRARREFSAVREHFAKGVKVLNALGPLTLRFVTGPFGPGSLYAKTLMKIRLDRPATSSDVRPTC